MELDEFDPLSSSTSQCPYPFFEKLRERTRPWPLDSHGVSLVGTYEQCDTVLSDDDGYSARSGVGLPRKLTAEARAIHKKGYPRMNPLLGNDPPTHTHYRNLVKAAFNPRRVRMMEPGIRQIACELADSLPEGSPVDFVHEFASRLPLMVIADALGVSRGDLADFKLWSDDTLALVGADMDHEHEMECHRSLNAMQHYLAARVAERRESPTDDLLTDLVTARDPEGGEGLNLIEILNVAHVLLVAGNETTTNLMSSALNVLMARTEHMEKARTDNDHLSAVIEEVLRLESPVQGTGRITRHAVQLGDATLPEGTRIISMLGAASRDPEMFPNPDEFDPTRRNVRSHLAFGSGIHFCLGAPLARLEASIAFQVLFERFDAIELAVDESDLVYVHNFVVRALETLPIRVHRKTLAPASR